MIIRFTGKKPEVVTVLGGRRVVPSEQISVAGAIAATLLRTKRWRKETKKKELKQDDS